MGNCESDIVYSENPRAGLEVVDMGKYTIETRVSSMDIDGKMFSFGDQPIEIMLHFRQLASDSNKYVLCRRVLSYSNGVQELYGKPRIRRDLEKFGQIVKANFKLNETSISFEQ